MAQRQLNIRSDEAAERVARLTKALGRTTTRVVEDALREYEERRSSPENRARSPEAQKRYEIIMAAAADARARIKPGADWDESWMYDENGLPR